MTNFGPQSQKYEVSSALPSDMYFLPLRTDVQQFKLGYLKTNIHIINNTGNIIYVSNISAKLLLRTARAQTLPCKMVLSAVNSSFLNNNLKNGQENAF